MKSRKPQLNKQILYFEHIKVENSMRELFSSGGFAKASLCSRICKFGVNKIARIRYLNSTELQQSFAISKVQMMNVTAEAPWPTLLVT